MRCSLHPSYSRLPLTEVVAIVEAEGARLRAEFYLARGPRGERGSAPIDREIESAYARSCSH